MKIYYDKNTGCMLLEGIHEISKSSIEINKETHDAILNRAPNEQVYVVDDQVLIKKIEVSEIEQLSLAKTTKTNEIDSARDMALMAGFEFGGRLYDSDTESLQNINGLVTQTLLQPTFTTVYITKNNEIVQLDSVSIQALGEAARAYKEQVIFKARTLKDQVLSAKSIDAINSIKWN